MSTLFSRNAKVIGYDIPGQIVGQTKIGQFQRNVPEGWTIKTWVCEVEKQYKQWQVATAFFECHGFTIDKMPFLPQQPQLLSIDECYGEAGSPFRKTYERALSRWKGEIDYTGIAEAVDTLS